MVDVFIIMLDNLIDSINFSWNLNFQRQKLSLEGSVLK